MKTLALFLILCFGSLALADDFKTIDGKEYKNVTVSRVEPDGIVLKTKSGISKVYFVELPKEVQERFHYDAEKAARYSAEQAVRLAPQLGSKESSAESTREEDKTLQVEIIQVLPGGVLAYSQVTQKRGSGSQSSGQPQHSLVYSDVPTGEGKNIFLQGLAAALQKASVFKFRRMPTGHTLIKTPVARAGLWRNGYSLNSLNASNNSFAAQRA
jgi:hypothetical protein